MSSRRARPGTGAGRGTRPVAELDTDGDQTGRRERVAPVDVLTVGGREDRHAATVEVQHRRDLARDAGRPVDVQIDRVAVDSFDRLGRSLDAFDRRHGLEQCAEQPLEARLGHRDDLEHHLPRRSAVDGERIAVGADAELVRNSCQPWIGAEVGTE